MILFVPLMVRSIVGEPLRCLRRHFLNLCPQRCLFDQGMVDPGSLVSYAKLENTRSLGVTPQVVSTPASSRLCFQA